MNREDARAGRRVVVVRFDLEFEPGRVGDRSVIIHRHEHGAGVLMAPAPNGGGHFWYVRYNNMRVALHHLNELDLSVSQGPQVWDPSARVGRRLGGDEPVDLDRDARDRAQDLADAREAALFATRIAEDERRRQMEADEADLISTIENLETRIANLQARLEEERERLTALRENRRRYHTPAPPPPPPPREVPKIPEEVGERHIDI